MNTITYNSISEKTRYLVALLAIIPLLLPQISMAHIYQPTLFDTSGSIVSTNFWPNYKETFDSSDALWSARVAVTAYNSELGQTDSTPFITANGEHVRDGIIATNMLPFGTKVRFPEVYGNKIFTVEDRMNKRYWYRADIWMAEKQDAKNFGVKYLTMEVL